MLVQRLMISNSLLQFFTCASFRMLLAALTVSGLTACGDGLSGNEENASDPVIENNPVAFIRRELVLRENSNELADVDLRRPAEFNAGAVLYLKNQAALTAPARDISSAAFSGPTFLNNAGQLLYDVKDLEVSHDGSKLLFSMRAPEIEDADEEDQPKWNIWEYDIPNATLRRVIADNFVAEQGHDIAPAYLSDDLIVFSSTRQRRSMSIRLDEGKGLYTAQDDARTVDNFVLHIMKTDGTNIRQLTFNQSHDLDPIVLPDGRILFSRWDNAGGTAGNGFNLYRVNPDGTGLTLLYGRHSHSENGRTVQFVKPHLADNGKIVVQLREMTANAIEWQSVEVDVDNYVERTVGINGASGFGHTPVVNGVTNAGPLGLNGIYGSAFPIYDGSNRYLVSWAPCRLIPADPTRGTTPINCTQERIDSGEWQAAPPLFDLWMLNNSAQTQLLVERSGREGYQYDEAVLVASRTLPRSYSPDPLPEEFATLGDELTALARDADGNEFGVIHIRSVYDFDGVAISPTIAQILDPVQTPPAQRAARFVRLEKPAELPSREVRDFSNTAFGRAGNQRMREILGYAPVEPDGSVMVAVPANVPFSISVLNSLGERVTARHENWLQVKPGEVLSCNGCHTANSTVPHGRPDAAPAPLNAGAPTTGLPYSNSNPAYIPDMGHTMATTYTLRQGDFRRLAPDIIYADIWTDTSVATAAPDINRRYADLSTGWPMSNGCRDTWLNQSFWRSFCRIVINYPNHIHPLWSVDRQVFDETDPNLLLEDRTCIACHTTSDAGGMPQVAAAQLDLTDGDSDQQVRHLKSFRELLFNDNEQELVGGVLQDRLVGTGVFDPVLDGNGNPVLDGSGNPVLQERQATVTVPPSLNAGNARTSTRFFSRFAAGGSHAGYLTEAELKLLREWVDIGAQYYNNPFDAPLN